jgi:hypothetical protein
VIDDSPPAAPHTAGQRLVGEDLLATRHAPRQHTARAVPSGKNRLDSQRHRAADLPDRLRGGAARYTDYRDAASGLRVRAACAAGEMSAVEMARWPAALEPWLDAATRARALPPTGRRPAPARARRKAA